MVYTCFVGFALFIGFIPAGVNLNVGLPSETYRNENLKNRTPATRLTISKILRTAVGNRSQRDRENGRLQSEVAKNEEERPQNRKL